MVDFYPCDEGTGNTVHATEYKFHDPYILLAECLQALERTTGARPADVELLMVKLRVVCRNVRGGT